MEWPYRGQLVILAVQVLLVVLGLALLCLPLLAPPLTVAAPR
jgi:preprotein translocase subunit SecE